MSTRKSIDDATPEDWNNLNKRHRKDLAWLDDESDNEPNDHPVFGDKPDNKPDMVNRPAHYNNGNMECIDAIRGMLSHEEYIGYLRGNSLKYRWRFRYKGKPVEDLRKARWYEDRLLNYELEHPSEQLR